MLDADRKAPRLNLSIQGLKQRISFGFDMKLNHIRCRFQMLNIKLRICCRTAENTKFQRVHCEMFSILLLHLSYYYDFAHILPSNLKKIHKVERSYLTCWNQKLQAHALRHNLLIKHGSLLSCCLVILTYDFSPKTEFKENLNPTFHNCHLFLT